MRLTPGAWPRSANPPPASSAAGLGASYIVQGQRGSTLGLASDILTVEFGMDSGGGAVQGAVTLKTAPTTEGDQANLRVAA